MSMFTSSDREEIPTPNQSGPKKSWASKLLKCSFLYQQLETQSERSSFQDQNTHQDKRHESIGQAMNTSDSKHHSNGPKKFYATTPTQEVLCSSKMIAANPMPDHTYQELKANVIQQTKLVDQEQEISELKKKINQILLEKQKEIESIRRAYTIPDLM